VAALNADLDEARSPTRSIIRTAIVVGITASVLAVSLPGLLPGMRENGTVLNVGLDASGRVTSVDDVSARGGLKVGDRVEPASMTLTQWEPLLWGIPIAVGDALSLTVDRDGRMVRLAIKADRVTGWPSYWVYLTKTFSQAVYLLVAGALVLLRPSRLTWSFFALSVGYGEEITQPWFWRNPATSIPMLWWLNLWNGIVITPGALLIFAASFPGRTSGAFWRFVDRAGIPVNVVLTVQNAVFFATALSGSSVAFMANSLPLWSLATIAGLLLVVAAYWSSAADQRQRLKWVIFAFVASYLERSVAGYQEFSGGIWPASWSSAGFTADTLAIVNLLVPLAVAYAVLKHRVLDINFVFSRALTYGIITSLIVGAFAVVDLILAKALEQRQLAVAVEFVVAIAFGFGLNGIHRQVDAVLDRLLFRSRHLAEKAIERLVAGLPHVTSAKALDVTLVEDPARTLNLYSAAAFIKDESGRFDRRAAVGWPDGASTALDADDPLVVNLHGELGTMRVREVRRGGVAYPTGQAAPVIAVPMFVRRRLLGFTLYGAHVSGEDIDPDEQRLLERLAHAAAATYDHIDSEAVRNKLHKVTLELDLMKAAARS
jgi:GAF domain-containing protein